LIHIFEKEKKNTLTLKIKEHFLYSDGQLIVIKQKAKLKKVFIIYSFVDALIRVLLICAALDQASVNFATN
jgi:hypothetical protein